MSLSLRLFKRRTRAGKDIWHYRGSIDGDRLRGTTGTTDRKEAARFVAKIERDYGQRGAAGSTLTFPKAVIHYLKAGKSDKYLDKIEDHWKNTKVRNMTAGAIRQSAIDLFPGASGATWNRQVITPTQAIINHCAKLELCAPIRIERFKFEKKIKKPITTRWLETFCAYADPKMSALALFMFATGCRISEARRLEWSDIDFNERTILIRKTKNKRERLPSMPPKLLVALANLPRDAKPFGNPETTLRRHWDDIIAAVPKTVEGFARLTFHSCRHGFATKLLRDGIDPKTAAWLGGWESVSLFLDTYAHAMQDSRIADRIFDTRVTREEGSPEPKQEVSGK